jgi:hypothetical protein
VLKPSLVSLQSVQRDKWRGMNGSAGRKLDGELGVPGCCPVFAISSLRGGSHLIRCRFHSQHVSPQPDITLKTQCTQLVHAALFSHICMCNVYNNVSFLQQDNLQHHLHCLFYFVSTISDVYMINAHMFLLHCMTSSINEITPLDPSKIK